MMALTEKYSNDCPGTFCCTLSRQLTNMKRKYSNWKQNQNYNMSFSMLIHNLNITGNGGYQNWLQKYLAITENQRICVPDNGWDG